METFFGSEFFSGNRQRLRELFIGTAPIVLTANGLLQRNGDINYDFRQDSNFWYLTGIRVPDAILVIDKEKEYLILPDLGRVDEALGAPHDVVQIRARSGIDQVLNEKDGWRQLSSRLKRVKHVATLATAPAYLDDYGMFTNPARARLMERLKAVNNDIEPLDLRTHIMRMRMVKQAPELQAIQSAVDIATSALRYVHRRLKTYSYEYEIEAEITKQFRTHGALGHSFGPIVASGKNTCHIHYQANNDPLKDARALYIDVGAEVDHYASDIARTYFLKGPNKREKAVHEAVRNVQEFAIGRLKPGISIRDNELAVEHYLGEKLRELALIKNIDRDSVRQYFPHATSHYLGLDAHDTGDYDRPLEPGMVLAVEPGIYIKEEGLGVRIEDNVLITEKGCKVLSGKLK